MVIAIVNVIIDVVVIGFTLCAALGILFAAVCAVDALMSGELFSSHRRNLAALARERRDVLARGVQTKQALDQEAFRAARAMHDVARNYRN